MFITTTLIASIDSHVPTLDAGISAFHTPNVFHFCAVLLLAGILSAPWQAFSIISLLLSLSGVGAVAYLIIVMRRMRQVPEYHTPLKDWLWYNIFPLFAYIVLVAAGLMLPINPSLALYLVSAVMVVLLFLGIHNAWDLVTYLAIDRSHPESKSQDEN